MRVAYLLQVHKNPEQVNILIRQLLSEADADIYVHVDKKSVGAMAGRLIRDPRVTVLETHLNVWWSDISCVDATLLMMRAALASGRDYDFLSLRSGQDLMVRSGIGAFLAKHRGRSFISARRIPREDRFASLANLRWADHSRRLYDAAHPYRLWRSLLIRLYGLGIKPTLNPARIPDHMELFHGSAWFCMSLSHARYALEFVDGNPWYRKAFAEALVPDEWFFQTLFMNSPLAPEMINRHLVYLRWGKTHRDRNHPVIFTSGDIAELEASGEYFARKFDLAVDRRVIEYFAAATGASRSPARRQPPSMPGATHVPLSR